MIVESVVAGLTIIVVSSLLFSNSLIKKQRQWEKEDEEAEIKRQRQAEKHNSKNSEEAFNLKPFLVIKIGTECPMCSRAATQDYGLRQPKSCEVADEFCTVTMSHLHVECTWCCSKWLMKTAN